VGAQRGVVCLRLSVTSYRCGCALVSPGMAAARGRGGVGGRPSLVIAEKLAVARRMLSEGRGKAVIARTIGVSRPTLYAHLAAAVDVAEVVV